VLAPAGARTVCSVNAVGRAIMPSMASTNRKLVRDTLASGKPAIVLPPYRRTVNEVWAIYHSSVAMASVFVFSFRPFCVTLASMEAKTKARRKLRRRQSRSPNQNPVANAKGSRRLRRSRASADRPLRRKTSRVNKLRPKHTHAERPSNKWRVFLRATPSANERAHSPILPFRGAVLFHRLAGTVLIMRWVLQCVRQSLAVE